MMSAAAERPPPRVTDAAPRRALRFDADAAAFDASVECRADTLRRDAVHCRQPRRLFMAL